MPFAPVFRSVGAVTFNPNTVVDPTDLAPSLPATRVSGNVLVLITACRSITATCATPAGWTKHADYPQTSGTASGGKFYVFFLVCTGSEVAPTVTWTGVTTGTSGDSSSAVILCYRNVDTSGGAAAIADGTAVKSDQAAQTTNIPIASMTTTLDNSLAIAPNMKFQDNGSVTVTADAAWTERADGATSNGAGHGLEVADFVKTPAGATGAVNMTPNIQNSTRTLSTTFAIKGSAADGGLGGGVVSLTLMGVG